MGRISLRQVNVGNLLVLAGVGWLGFSFWLPYGTANRVYRIESRCAVNARQLAAVSDEFGKLDWQSDAQRDKILHLANRRAGHSDPQSSNYLRATTPPTHLDGKCFMFEGKHYFYLVTNTPRRDHAIEKPGKKVAPADPPGATEPPLGRVVDPPLDIQPLPLPVESVVTLETYAWPKSPRSGSRTVFFVPSDGAAAFTRNLGNRYVGKRRVPLPGNGRPDSQTEKQKNDYLGLDDEQWICVERADGR